MLPFLNNPKDLDPSYKMDLDLWDCFGRKNLHLITEEIRYNFCNLLFALVDIMDYSLTQLHTGGLFHCDMLDNSIFHFWGLFCHFYPIFDGKPC